MAGRLKGSPKTGGRKAGTPNKIRGRAAELMNEYGFDPIRSMIAIAADPANEIAIRARMLSELAQYVYPKLRQVEHSGPGGGAIPLMAVNPLDEINRELARLAEREHDPPRPLSAESPSA
jgi:hypothetical protein